MWDNVLELMTVIAVITNCALIGVTSSHYWPSGLSTATRMLVVVIAEHAILFLKVELTKYKTRNGLSFFVFCRSISERVG